MKFDNMEIGGRKFTALFGETKCPEYMLKMLEYNKTDLLVPFSVVDKDGLTKLIYETDIKIPVRNFLMENGADINWIKNYLVCADRLLSVCGEYLIDSGYIMINPGSVYYSADDRSLHFIFNPFEKTDFAESCRKLTADIAGNYFVDYGVSGEIFRERLLREAGKKDFNIRTILARWDEFCYMGNKPPEEAKPEQSLKTEKRKVVFKDIFGKFNKKEEVYATTAITNTTGHMCLTGICSINTRIPIKDEGVTVGRNMLQKEYGLFNNGIGKSHARVYRQDGIIFATDLGSKNGTYLNGEQMEKRVPVKIEKGDILAFSDEEFILC